MCGVRKMTELFEKIAAYEPACEQEENDKRLILQYAALFDDLFTRKNEMAHFTASAWVVTPDRKKALMAYHNLYNSWAWLGGHADGETELLDVALREVREESGAEHVRPVTKEIYSLEILPVAQHFKRGKFVSAHLHLNLTYLLETDERELLRCKPDENSGVRWFLPEEICPAVSEPPMRGIYQKLMEKLHTI